jgi:hypothetical protein
MPHDRRRPTAFLRRPRAFARAARAATLAAAVALLTLPAIADADGPDVASPNGKVAGLRLGEWLGRFWTHALPLPTAENPIIGNGDLCPVFDRVLIHYGISGEICTVARGTDVLIVSVIAPECSTNEPGDFGAGPDLASLLACARAIEATLISEQFTVDGKPIRDLERFRVETGLLATSFAADNPFDAIPGPAKSAAVGTAVIVKGLDVGEHELVSHVVQRHDDLGLPPSDITGVARVVVNR